MKKTWIFIAAIGLAAASFAGCDEEDRDLSSPACTKSICDGNTLIKCNEDGTTSSEQCGEAGCSEEGGAKCNSAAQN